MGKKTYDSKSGILADIDVLLVKGHALAVVYECKGKSPGVRVTPEEVEDWLRRIPTFRAYIRAQQSLANADVRFELWTSGEFEPDALEKLKYEKLRRTASPIDWKDGSQVREFGRKAQDSAVTKAIDEHFFKHPLARESKDLIPRIV